MQVQITVTNPSFDFLLALGMALHGTTTFGVMAVDTEADATDTPAHDPFDSDTVYRSFNGFHVGDRVHWKGAKFEFDAHIEKIGRATNRDDKFVWLRRCDTGKLVSLTMDDLKVGSLSHVSDEDSDDLVRIVTAEDIDFHIDIDTEVHWKGAKFEFDGVVERIETDGAGVPDTDGWYDDRVKVLFIRRNDTDKLVSLTLRDLQTGSLTLK